MKKKKSTSEFPECTVPCC